jgi:glycosyltransferase involved in cell wall biosynthesis
MEVGYNLSACCFIRDTFEGAFCLWESMASLLPFADEFIVRDLGSTDGTLEALQEIAASNPKVKVQQGGFPVIDAGAFATLANELIASCQHDRVLYFQADEIWHEDLLGLMRQRFDAGQFDLSFWRIQYRDNFQRVKWFPHLVHRVGTRGNFHFDGDGMNTNRTWDAKICSDYGGEFFPRWGEMGQDGVKPYVNQMILDVSLVGGFRDNIAERRRKHAPFWHEEALIEGKPADQWQAEAEANPDWTRETSPYNLPRIMRYHVGKTLYTLRADLLDALKSDRTWEYIQSLGGWR